MTRRKVSWWARLSANPAKFIKTPAGKVVVEVLTQWWIEAENVYRPDLFILDRKGIAPKPPYGRYTLPGFYHQLERVPLPPLTDADEIALDRVFEAFFTFTVSRKARKLAARSSDQVRAAITDGLTGRPELDLDPDLAASLGSAVDGAVHHAVHHSVHQSVHHSVHQSVHSAVHSSVHHAVTDGGHGGGHGGGGGGHH